MYEMLKRENKKSESFPNKTTLKSSVNRVYKEINRMPDCNNLQQITNKNDGLFPRYNIDFGSYNCVSKKREVIQMKIYNKGTPVNNIDDLKSYIKDIFGKDINITYNMFGEVPESIVEEAIQQLGDCDINDISEACYASETCNSSDIVQVIQNKIKELTVKEKMKKKVEDEEERNRIQALAIRLKREYHEYDGGSDNGRFVGDKTGWHIHIVGRGCHLRNGEGNRCDIHLQKPEGIMIAVIDLSYNGESDIYQKKCYCWLRHKMIELFDKDLPEEYRVNI